MKPNKERTQLTLRLPCELNETLKEISEVLGLNKNSIIINALWDFVYKKKGGLNGSTTNFTQ